MPRRLAIFFLLLLLPLSATAQFYRLGSDPAGIRWKWFRTGSYKLIYPEGADSMAVRFAVELERYGKPLASTAGYEPNEKYRTPMPVVIHPYMAYSNGMVVWAPRRMALLATPDAYDPEALPWIDYLAVHEGRHVAQMQFIRGDGPFRAADALLGQLWAGGASALYPGPSFFEGDAVTAETALTLNGRGRSSDFLEYMRVSFAEGQYRNYWQWRYSSLKNYTPDYYRVGYMLTAGMRTSFNAPGFTARYFSRIFEKRYPLMNLQKTVKEISGLSFGDAFRKIEEDFQAEWELNDSLRAPFLTAARKSPETRRYETNTALVFKGDSLLSLRGGLTRTRELAYTSPSGEQKRLSAFSSMTSRLAPSEVSGRIYWTEYTPDARWGLRSFSNLRYLDRRGRKHTLTRGERYFNPTPAPSDSFVVVTVYPPDGSSAIALVHESNGREIARFRAPDGMQVVESAWMDGVLYASAITDDGFGIYRVYDWNCLLEPCQAKINRFFGHEGRLWFSSDRDGTTELYSLTQEGTLWKETSLRFGGNDWVFHGDSLYFSAPTAGSRAIYAMAADSLLGEEAPAEPFPRPIADKLSEQEPLLPEEDFTTTASAPQPYSKLGNLFKVHSWAPVYVEYDAVRALSYESTSTPSYLGATAWVQNELENFYGSFGVSVENVTTAARPVFHAQFTYDGWYPVLEVRADVNAREAFERSFSFDSEKKGYLTVENPAGKPQVKLALNAYIPWNLTSGGWSRGVVPYLKTTYSNDRWQTLPKSEARRALPVPDTPVYQGFFVQAGIRAYTMLPVAASAVFPRWGLGMELNIMDMPLMRETYGGTALALVYGYLPGLLRTHGIKFAAQYSRSFGCDWDIDTGVRASVEYAMPFAAVDWTFLCPAFYVRNFQLRLYGSYEFDATTPLGKSLPTSTQNAYAGAMLGVQLGNFLWIPYDTLVGVKYLYNPINPDLSGLSAVFTIDL